MISTTKNYSALKRRSSSSSNSITDNHKASETIKAATDKATIL